MSTKMSCSLLGVIMISTLGVCGRAPAGLVGHWTFDEGSGAMAYDSSGGGANGKVVGSPQWVSGKMNAALKFDGSTYVVCGWNPNLNITGSVTIAAWVKRDTMSNDEKVGGNQDGFTGGYKLSLYNQRAEMEIRGANNVAILNRNVLGGTVLQPGLWYHVTGVYSQGNYLRSYVNGNLDRGMETSAQLGSSAGPLILGREPYSNIFFLIGALDDVCVYDEALTDQQVQALATNNASTRSSSPTPTSVPQGSLVAWGSNAFGQTNVPAGKDFVAIAAGSYYNLALRADGSIVGWGKNEHGQATPPTDKGYTAIAAGNYHGLALKADGSIVGWGGNDYGESTPPEGTGFTALAAGDSYSLALKSDGSIVGWGLNDRGQSSRPGGNNFIAIAAGRVQSAALRANGTIIVWGVTGWVLEGGYWVLYGRSPTDTDFVGVGVGSTHGLGLKRDGSVEVWGYIDMYPPAVKGLVAIAAGSDHDLALRADGSILAWSRNSSGQATPPAGTGFIAIAGGREHSLAIKKE